MRSQPQYCNYWGEGGNVYKNPSSVANLSPINNYQLQLYEELKNARSSATLCCEGLNWGKCL